MVNRLPTATGFSPGSRRAPRRERGLTLVEIVLASAILAILAAAAIPSARVFVKRQKEIELRRALREIRTAIDQYHRTAKGQVTGVTIRVEGVANLEHPYPPDLKTLVEGAESNFDFKIKFLRRVPRDPFNADADEHDEAGWSLRSYQDDPDSSSWGKQNVYDVRSASEARALDGSYYKDW